MRIIHVPYTYYPSAIGGAEVYVESLSNKLLEYGYRPIIVVPSNCYSRYSHKNKEIRKFRIDPDKSRYFDFTDHIAESHFEQIVKSTSPDLIHIHNSILRVANPILSTAKKYNVPVVFTLHVPNITCFKGSLLKWGNENCNGTININTCTACTLNKHSVPVSIARLVSTMPGFISGICDIFNLRGGIWTGLRMKQLVKKRKNTLLKFASDVDILITQNEWSHNLLLNNGIPEQKIKKVRVGIDQNRTNTTNNKTGTREKNTLRLVYMGRMDPNKGIDVLLKSLKLIPDADLTLDIYGIPSIRAREYEASIRNMAANDKRISFKQPVENKKVVRTIKNYDFLVVPSQYFETSPLVILEAFAAGLPVIGSDLPSIKERISDRFNGLLVIRNSVNDWAKTLKSVSENRYIASSLSKNVTPPKTIEELAMEMIKIYNKLISTQNTGSPTTSI